MDESLHAGVPRDPGEHRRAGMVDPLEGLRSALPQNADAIDQRAAAGKKGGEHDLIVDRCTDRRDLPDIAHRPQELRLLGVAAADRDHVAATGQPLDHIAADKPGPAEHRGSMTSHVFSNAGAPMAVIYSAAISGSRSPARLASRQM